MKEIKNYDVIIIGGGPAGYEGAVLAAKNGLKTAIIDRGSWGGVCLNVGCIPTKTLLKSARSYFEIANHSKDLGIDLVSLKNNLNINWSKMQDRKQKVVKQLTNGIKFLFKANKVDSYEGVASSIDATTIQISQTGSGDHTFNVENIVIKAKYIILAIGTLPKTLPIDGFEAGIFDKKMVTSTGILSIKKLPQSITIIGGGVIGIEFAYLFTALNVKVTIVEALPTILAVFDNDVTKSIHNTLLERKATIYTNAKINHLKNDKLSITVNNKTQIIKSDICLLSVGRTPIFKGFENLGIEKDARGFIKINEYMQTNVLNIYAAGDITGKLLLAHVATAQCKAAVYHILNQLKKPLNYDNIPNVVYCFPEVASVGKTEKELKKANIEFIVAKIPFQQIGKALADNNINGFVKLIAEPKYGEILGGQILAETADDMISQIAMAMELELSVFDLETVIFPHPTLSESIGEAAHKWVESYKKLKS